MELGRWRGVLAVCAVVGCGTALSACSTLIGLGDFERDSCLEDCGGAGVNAGPGKKPGAEVPGGNGTGTGKADEDGGSGATTLPDGAPAASLPSYCSGVVLYLSLDNTTYGAKGEAPQSVGSAHNFEAARHGGGLFIESAQFNYEPVLARDIGTIALWLAKPKCQGESQKRIYLDGYGLVGPIMQCDPSNGGRLGVAFSNGTGSAGIAEAMLPNEGPLNQWNFVATTWQKAQPAVSFLLWDSAGALSVATSGSAPLPSFSSASKMNLRVGNNAPPGPNASYDDVVAWNRVLSTDELNALRTSGKSFGANCKL